MKWSIVCIFSFFLAINLVFTGCNLPIEANYAVYTVSFDSRGGTVVPSQDVDENGLVSVPTPEPSKERCSFATWCSDATLTNEWDFAHDRVTADMTLYAAWTYDDTHHLNLRDSGPAGGFICYINPNADTDGWKYLECAPASTEWPSVVWGGYGTAVAGADSTGYGAGRQNTIDIVNAFGNVEPYGGLSDYAAKLCNDLEINGYTDWFLPSMGELGSMYTNLYQQSMGGFDDNAGVYYWSSTENFSSSGFARGRCFENGAYVDNSKNNHSNVRAVRLF